MVQVEVRRQVRPLGGAHRFLAGQCLYRIALRADYAKTARAKGLSPARVVGVHVLRNSLIPVVTFLGVELGSLMAGAVVIENIFNVPGVGFALARAVRTGDGPTVVTLVSLLVVVFLVVNLVVDVLYALIDPRIRYA